jgi:hypothetical protein
MKYWDKMEIFRNKKGEEEKLFLSLNRPAFFVQRNYEVFGSYSYKYSDKELEEISSFYNKNYRIGKSNNTIILSVSDLNRFIFISSELLTIKQENRLIGSVISILLPIAINTNLKIHTLQLSERFKLGNENSVMFACTSFLILEEKFRGKGKGMALIQESLQILHDNGGLGAYFINSVSRCKNSILLNSWYYPLNFQKLDSCKFNYSREYKSYFIKHLNEGGKSANIIKICEENSKIAYDFYMDYMRDKKFYFTPNYEYWLKWILSFDTYILIQETKIVGLFCFNNNYIRYPLNKIELYTGILLFCIGKQPDTLLSALTTAQTLYDIITLYEVGDLTKKILSNVFAQKSHTCHINFFNTSLQLSSEEFYSPLF